MHGHLRRLHHVVPQGNHARPNFARHRCRRPRSQINVRRMADCRSRPRYPFLDRLHRRHSFLSRQPQTHIHGSPAFHLRPNLRCPRLLIHVLGGHAALSATSRKILALQYRHRHHHAHHLRRHAHRPRRVPLLALDESVLPFGVAQVFRPESFPRECSEVRASMLPATTELRGQPASQSDRQVHQNSSRAATLHNSTIATPQPLTPTLPQPDFDVYIPTSPKNL